MLLSECNWRATALLRQWRSGGHINSLLFYIFHNNCSSIAEALYYGLTRLLWQKKSHINSFYRGSHSFKCKLKKYILNFHREMLLLAQNAALSVYEFCRSPKYLGRIFQIGIKDAIKTMQTFYPNRNPSCKIKPWWDASKLYKWNTHLLLLHTTTIRRQDVLLTPMISATFPIITSYGKEQIIEFGVGWSWSHKYHY